MDDAEDDGILVEVHRRGSDDRALLAVVAGRLLDLDPRDVAVTQTCPHCGGAGHGQPGATSGRGARVYLSLARAGGLVAVAGRIDGPVGVDIELLDRVSAAGFDDVAFTAAERVAIDASPTPVTLRARYWTAKEALLKAAGTGLRTDPRLVELGGGPVLVSWASSTIPTDDVHLRSWEPRPGYIATVASIGRADQRALISSGTGTR